MFPRFPPSLPLPGDSEPLFTEDVPCCARPIFAASAAHSILLEPGADVEVHLAEAAGGDHQAQLQLEVWGWAGGWGRPPGVDQQPQLQQDVWGVGGGAGAGLYPRNPTNSDNW